VSAVVPGPLSELIARSAAPEGAQATVARLVDERPTVLDQLMDHDTVTALGEALVRVAAASNALGRLCVADSGALEVLAALDRPIPIEVADAPALARAKRLEMLRIAARDLLGYDDLDEVGAGLARLAGDVLTASVALAGPGGSLAVVGMGKLGGDELNYASDVDVIFVTGDGPDDDLARRVLDLARRCFRVDANLRPEGRAGPLTRSLDSYRGYWERWAATWEFQALLKARPVAGDLELGSRFESAARDAVWQRHFSADELAEVRSMKLRSEQLTSHRRSHDTEIKRGPGGIRDIEFAVQLLQLVHGRHDADIRVRSTLGALAALGQAGYVSAEDAAVLDRAYRFLRTVEHRVQLVEEEQTHRVPSDPVARRRLARVMGFQDDATNSATARFDDALRSYQRDVRAIHERLFFRPLLEAFATVEAPMTTGPAGSVAETMAGTMSSDAVALRLEAFGFGDRARTRTAVEELAGGLTRSSRLMSQLLPLLLDWLSLTPDPDLGLLGLRNLVVHAHHRAVLVAAFRESPEVARRLCLLLGSSRALAEEIEHHPELIATLDEDAALAPTPRHELVIEANERLRRRDTEDWRRAQLVRVRQEEHLRIAARDLLGIDAVEETGRALTVLAEALLETALGLVQPEVAFCVVGMGRLGGGELAYASDLDVLLVYEGDDASGEAAAERLLRVMHGPSPSQRVAPIDLGLRPEGGQGRLARTLSGYRAYFERWAQTWERQALVRARVVAGDRVLGERFMEAAHDFVWARPLAEPEVATIRRIKARMERERVSPHEDPEFHLKLGRGSLSDVEWTVQLLQLLNGVTGASTMVSLDLLEDRSALTQADAAALRDAYRFCEFTRNRWHLVGALPGGASPGDALPSEAHQLSRLARSLGTTPSALRADYRRVTRRARRVVEHAFYGIEDA
jgi:glutamate-ammonia-ligase adenylyltransferase